MTINKESLVAAARACCERSHAPYSGVHVCAAVQGASGAMYLGNNVENAAYPSGICAERKALVKAISEGERHFEALVVATENGGSPCGSCRQMLAEFGLDLTILIVNGEGKVLQETSLKELLPLAFTPKSLK